MAGKDNGGGGASYFPDRPGNATHILLSSRRPLSFYIKRLVFSQDGIA
ncbi:hypothetical protein [Coprobacter fastidiosus]